MTATCHFPGCDKPVRPVPRARYCSWEHLLDAAKLRDRVARRKKRAAIVSAAVSLLPVPAAVVTLSAPLPPDAFADNHPRAEADRGSPGRLPLPMPHGLGASSLVAA